MGEFEKRIVGETETIDMAYHVWVGSQDEKDLKAFLSILNEVPKTLANIIDDARKDYPKRKTPADIPRNEEGFIIVKNVTWRYDSYGNELDSSLLKRRHDWFKRWVGSS